MLDELFPEEVAHLRSLAVATLIDLMRNEGEPVRSDAAIELCRFEELVREILPTEANAVLVEAACIALPKVQVELARCRAGKLLHWRTVGQIASQSV